MAFNLSSTSLAIKYNRRYGSVERASDPALIKAAEQKKAFENKVAVDKPSTIFEQATEVKLSKTAQARERGAEDAVRTLSNAATYVNLAEGATNQVESLLEKARQNSEALKTEVDPTKRAALANDGASFLTEIDTVVSAVQLNDNSVVNGGVRSFSFDFRPEQPLGDSTFTFDVANFALTSSDLGVSSLNSAAFEEDAEGTTDTIEAAQDQLQTVRASVGKAKQTILDVADKFGIDTAQDLRGTGALKASEAEQFTNQLAKSIKDSALDSRSRQELDPNRVKVLLGDEEADPSGAQVITDAPTGPEVLFT